MCLQLVLPQYLRALPVYINSLRKSEVLLPGLRSSVHQRLQQRCQVLRMDTRSTSTQFYPLLLPLVSTIDTRMFVLIRFMRRKVRVRLVYEAKITHY